MASPFDLPDDLTDGDPAFQPVSELLHAPSRVAAHLPSAKRTTAAALELAQRFEGPQPGQNPFHQPADARPAFRDLEQARVKTTWRILRYVTQALGYAAPNDPLGFAVTDPKLHRAETPFCAYRVHPARPQVDPAAAGLPGLSAFRESVRATPLLPPSPEVPYPERIPSGSPLKAVGTAFTLAAAGLQLEDDGRLDTQNGLIGLVPSATGARDYDVYLRVLRDQAPTMDEVLAFEQDLLTSLARSLMSTNEDSLRFWLRSHLCGTEHEAYAIVQTAKVWAAALRPIDIESERVLTLRSLEAIRDRALKTNDYAAAISASDKIAKIVGLYEQQAAASRDTQFRNFEEYVGRMEALLEEENVERRELLNASQPNDAANQPIAPVAPRPEPTIHEILD